MVTGKARWHLLQSGHEQLAFFSPNPKGRSSQFSPSELGRRNSPLGKDVIAVIIRYGHFGGIRFTLCSKKNFGLLHKNSGT